VWKIKKIVSKGDYREGRSSCLLDSNEVKLQLQGKTTEVEDAISGNLVSEYIKYSDDNREETF